MAAAFSYVRKVLECVTNKGFKLASETSNTGTANRDVNNVFAKFLGPFESYIVSIQSLLIWERPYISAVALLVVNIAYWIIVTCSRRLYSFVAVVSLLVFLYRAWVYQIWPEIRVPPPEGTDTEGWTPVHPQVYSVPEISEHLNYGWLTLCHYWEAAWKIRETQPGLFCSVACGGFAILAVIGHMVPGVLLVYLTVMLMSFGPGLVLYVVPHTWLQTGHGLAHDTGSNEGSVDRDSELDEFLPITSRESDLTLSEHQEHNDDVITRDLGLESIVKDAIEQEDSLSHGLGSFPNMEDDISDDEVGTLDISSILMVAAASAALSSASSSASTLTSRSQGNNNNNGIHFVASHFKDNNSDDSDIEEAFIEGLSFSQVPEPSAVLESSTIRPLSMSSHMSSSRSPMTGSSRQLGKAIPPKELLTSKSTKRDTKLSPTIEVETPSPTDPQQTPGSDLDISEYELVSESELSS